MKNVALIRQAQRVYNITFKKAYVRLSHFNENKRRLSAHRVAWKAVLRLYTHLQQRPSIFTIRVIDRSSGPITIRV